MNLFVLLAILAVMIALHWSGRVPIIGWLFIWPLAVWASIRFGISPLVPASVTKLYLALTIVGLLAYIYADSGRYDRIRAAVTDFIVLKKHRLALNGVVLLLPLALAAKIYLDMTVEVRAPTFGRTIHPAPPNDINFKGKQIDLIKGKNPLRELETSDPEKYREHLERGKQVYYTNCVYCHGDDMNGDGIYAHAFFPVPANFNSPTTIAMLQEAYLFWRIAKGGPGLPAESGPWSSSMPAWENFLSEEEIWQVILYLYDYTGQRPRAEEEGH